MVGFPIFIILLFLMICWASSILDSLTAFAFSVFYIRLSLSLSNLLVGLLMLLVYLGSLMVLFAYIWIFISHSSRPPFSFLILPIPLFSVVLSSPSFPSPISSLLLASSLLLFMVFLLFWAMVVVIYVLDFSLGGFSA